MNFIIDTGVSSDQPFASLWGRIGKVDAIMDNVMDGLPPDAPQEAIDAAMVAVILGELHTAKLLCTVRQHFIQLWPLIVPLAEREPEQFDAILTDYAELASVLPADASENLQRKRSAKADAGPSAPRPTYRRTAGAIEESDDNV